MPDDTMTDKELARRMLAVARTYVYGRTKYRTGLDPDRFPTETDVQGRDRRRYPKEWFETSAKIAQEAFFQLRACKTQRDFVAYLVGTMCTHGLSSGERAYHEVAASVIGSAATDNERWEDVRSLAMLAVSTMAYLRPTTDTNQGGDNDE